MESSGDENNDLLKTNPFITPTIFTGIQMRLKLFPILIKNIVFSDF